MPKGKVAPVPCPKCGGQMWDNSDMKKPGSRAPDYSCKKGRDACPGGGVWLSDTERLATGGGGAAASTGPGLPARIPPVLEKLMGFCIDTGLELSKKFQDGEVAGADHDITFRIAQSIFDARLAGKGILEVEKKAMVELRKKAAEAAARAAEADAARKREALERERQASESQVGPGAGGDWPLGDYEPEGDGLPF